MNFSFSAKLLTASAVMLVVVGVGVISAAAGTTDTQQQSSPPHVSVTQSNAFAVLRGAPTKAQGIPVPADAAANLDYVANLAIRVPNSSTNDQVWVAPGVDAGGVCLLLKDPKAIAPAAGCGAIDDATKGQGVLSQWNNSHDIDVAGLVSDGVESVTINFADGTSTDVGVVDNVFSFHATKPTKSVSYSDPDGPRSFSLTGPSAGDRGDS